jgi:hypothetical protein
MGRGLPVDRSGFLPIPVDSSVFNECVKGNIEGPWVVAWCGSPGMERRSAVIAEAFGRVARNDSPPLKGIWMLTHETERTLAHELLVEFGAHQLVELRVGQSFDDWTALLPEVDLALHLHFSAYGHAGPALALSMATQTPVVVSDFGESDYLPDDAVIKVQPGITEVGELHHILRYISNLPLQSIGARGRLIARERHHPRSVAQQLRAVIEHHKTELSDMQDRWRKVERYACDALVQMIRGGDSSPSPWYEDYTSLWLEQAAAELGWGSVPCP